MGDFSAKLGTNNARETLVGYFGMGVQKSRGDQLVFFVEWNSLRITNTFQEKNK